MLPEELDFDIHFVLLEKYAENLSLSQDNV